MKKIFFVITFFNILILATCNKKTDKTKIEIIDGVEFIHNSESPLHPEITVSFEEELTISSENEAGEIILFQPQKFIVDSNNNMYISDYSDQTIKIFDDEGNYKGSFGSKGQGPGEFQRISAMSFLPDGLLLVLDHRNRITSLFDSNCQFVQSYQWLTDHTSILLVTDSTYCIEDRSTSIDDGLITIRIFDFSGNEIKNFGKFTAYPRNPVVMGNTRNYFYLSYIARSIFAVDHKHQRLYHCLSDKYFIEAYDGTGKLVKKIDKVYTPIPVTNEDVEKFRTGNGRIKKDSESYKIRKKFQIPDVKAIAEFMLVDSKGNLWIKTFEKKEKGNRSSIAYDIFNKDGYYYAKVWCDIRPSLFVRGKMYRLNTDEETGLKSLKRYRVIWNN